MTPEKVKRKLTAILSADVKGYSRLMGADEVGTIRILQTYRQVMSDLIQKKGGRVIDSPGDNVLVEFASVVDALESAVEIQRELKIRNADRSESRRMEFRIGINLGDVIEEGERIYGDGVNIAARIEGLAEGGGICISGTAFDHIGKRLPLGYEFMGEQEVKNIEKPVRVYRVLMEAEQAGKVIGERKGRGRRWLWAAVVAIILVAGALAFWNFYFRPPPIEPALKEKMAFPLPDKPSIAVLPFANMSDDPKQEYFCDGLTEQIITSLSKIDRLFVIARNSTIVYKGKSLKIQKVAEDLGVQYVLEGSIQRSADRVRITAQLINALAGRHIWAETYDRDLKDIFALQDEITINILTAVQGKLTEGEHALRSKIRETENLKAYEKVLQARELIRRNTKQDNESARQLAEEAIVLDPNFAWAYVSLGWTHYMDVRFGYSESSAKSLQKAFELAQKALARDDSIDTAHSLLGSIYLVKLQFEKAVEEAERAVALNPNGAQGIIVLAGILGHAGRWEESVSYAEKAIRLDPVPDIFKIFILGRAQFMIGHYDESIAAWEKALQKNSDYLPAYAFLAACYSSLGRDAEATAEVKEVLRIDPKFNVESHAKLLPYKNKTDIEREVSALRKAGLPDKPPLPLPDKPSIAVLPFVNMSEDKSQEFFSDGLTEEIITALSKTPKLFVIARNSSFIYKGKPVNVQQVGRELGVKYVLEGSVRRSGDQLRITAQLIDATTGNHLWAERYDREMKDIFSIQDEVTMKILTSLQVKLTEGEWASVTAKGTESLEAYLKLLEGLELLNALNRDDNALARRKFEEAITLDPKSAVAYSYLGFTYVMDFAFGIDREESMKKAFAYTQKALSLDDSQSAVYTTMEFMYGFMRRHEEAIAAGEKAVKNAPGSAHAQLSLGRALNFACRDKEALRHLEMAVRMNPIPPAFYYMHIGSAHLNLRNYEEAVSALKKALALTPRNEFARGFLMVAYVETGRMEEAKAELQEYLKNNPKPTPPEEFRKRSPWKDEEVTQRVIDAMRKLRS
jgi:adenylate cyclase